LLASVVFGIALSEDFHKPTYSALVFST
jgi:hypothetical protein